jgi:hypothetical protein
MGLSQNVVGELIGGGRGHRPPRGLECAVEGIGSYIEAVLVFLGVEHREHGPGVGASGRLLDGALKGGPHRGVLLGGDALDVAEAAQHGFVRAQLFGTSAPQHLAHGVRQNAVRVGHGGDDTGDDLVLQLEDLVGLEGAVVGLRPQVGARAGVDELRGDPQHGARLTQAAFDDVAGAELLADGADVHRLARVPQRRAAGDHLEIREPREAGHDVLGQSFGEGLQGRI